MSKRLKSITNNSNACLLKVQTEIKKIEGTIQTSSIEISYFLNKGSQLKNQNPYCFAKHNLSPYQMVELGVWQTAIEAVLLSIDDTAYCKERCFHCKKHRKTKGDLDASGRSEDLFDIFENDQSFNTPKKQSPTTQSSLIDFQTPGVASPNENEPKESDQFLKSPPKKIGKKSKTKLSYRNIDPPRPTITPDPPMTPKKRQRSPNNVIDGETPSKMTKIKSNKTLAQQSGIHVQNDHQSMEGITFLSSPLGSSESNEPQLQQHGIPARPDHQEIECSTVANSPLGLNVPLAAVLQTGQVTELVNAVNGNLVATPTSGKRSQINLKEDSPGVDFTCDSHRQSNAVTGEPDNKKYRTDIGCSKTGTGTHNITANQNASNQTANEGLKDKNSQLRGDKNGIRKNLKAKCVGRESDPDQYIEIKVCIVGNKPFNACFLHEKKQLVPLLEKELNISILRVTAITNKKFVLLKVQKENDGCFVNNLQKNGEVLVSGPNSSTILVTYKWPHRIVIRNVDTCINLECLKTDIETYNNVKIETITRLGKTTTVKIDIIGKKPPNYLRTPTLGKLAARIPYEYIEKTKYCLNCLSFLHEKHQCDEAPRCKNCMQPHPTYKCTASQSEFRCYFCAGNPNHPSRKCPSVHKVAAQYNNRENTNACAQETDIIQNTTELGSTPITNPADTADLHTTIENLRQLNKSQEDIITNIRRENVEKHTQSNSK